MPASLQCLKPVSSANQVPSTSHLTPTVSTSSSSTQALLFPSTSSIAVTVSRQRWHKAWAVWATVHGLAVHRASRFKTETN
ncbi:hypothetical protein TNCV_133451 [Trichonephila clavipes]|nr:hypothetical protein TNCV_133451 [Trichonephila clavipes]